MRKLQSMGGGKRKRKVLPTPAKAGAVGGKIPLEYRPMGKEREGEKGKEGKGSGKKQKVDRHQCTRKPPIFRLVPVVHRRKKRGGEGGGPIVVAHLSNRARSRLDGKKGSIKKKGRGQGGGREERRGVNHRRRLILKP